jgi:uncharacterized protein (DUF169 family)
MAKKKRDYSELDKFNFKYKPIGVKFMLEKPAGFKKPDVPLNMCEMLRYAQDGHAFYVGEEDLVCVGIEQAILGMKDPEPVLVSGVFGGDEGLFKDASSCRAMYNVLPSLPKGSVRYAAFAPIDKLPFDPDVLIMTGDIYQAQSILRSITYSTGMPFVSRATPVVACSWIFVYPVVSGELNYFVTGLGLGMQAMNIYPPGLFIMSVPFQKLPAMLENLKEINYNPNPPPGVGGAAHRKRVNKALAETRKKLNIE